tara:strand:+ start:3768 stop:5702 length:1935 start_codon:yes stop_codon:yes gene_type:complete
MAISDLRRSQIVIPFGPGGVYDFKDFSAMTMQVDEWEYNDRDCDAHQIKNARFIKYINKKLRFYEGFNSKRIYKLLHPPIAYDSNMSQEVRAQMGSVKVKKFPIWGLCSRCNALSKFDPFSRTNNKCKNTRVEPKREGKFTPCGQIKNGGKIEPVRFVGYCGKGHIEDFPWVKMMQRKCSPNCDMHNRSHTVNQPSLYLADNSLGNGFNSLMLQCGECKNSTSLAGVDRKTGQPNINDFIDQYGKKIFQCSGKKPWSTEDDEQCENMLEIQPRAASKLYSAVQCSSIFVPESDEVTHDFILDPIVQTWISENTLTSEIKVALGVMPSFKEKYELDIQQMLDMIQEERDIINTEIEQDDGLEDEDDNDFLFLEYETLCKKQVDDGRFISKTIPNENFSSKINDKFASLSQIKRLYSSVALLGFNRMTSDFSDKKLAFNAARTNANFLPAYEIVGEGIFIDFSYEKIQEWRTNNPSFKEKEKQLRKNSANNIFNDTYSNSAFNYGHVMMHTFSHLLMNQLSIECGYALTEIKERIYFCEKSKMAGVLIYTASSDSAGSLGGLVRMIKPNYFESLVSNAIANAQVCSNDPICKESNGQGNSGLCLASCHACSMIPDLACCTVPSNVFLDRNALIGNETNAKGYFSDF